MTNDGSPELMAKVGRIKWWKYKYLLIGALLINLLIINQFFLDHPVVKTGLSPFGASASSDSSKTVQESYGGEKKQGKEQEKPQAILPEADVPAAKGGFPVMGEPVEQPSDKFSRSSSVAATIIPPIPSTTSSVALYTAIPTEPEPLSTLEGPFSLHDYNFEGEFIGWPLQRLCNETQWVPGLIFVCDNNSGGIGNIRNFILTCIRYAIEAGAGELMLPRIQQRSDSDLANLFTGGFHEFDYFFDKQHFLGAMNTYCPQMHVHNTRQDVPFQDNILAVNEFWPKKLNVDTDGCDERGVNRHLDQFRPKFHTWLSKEKHKPTPEEPISIRFKWATFFEWPIYRDGPEFANTFGDILRVRKDIRELAAATLREMSTFTGAQQDSNRFQGEFIGVHLRTEKDALGFWPTYQEQSDGYIKEARKSRLKYGYIACGDEHEAKRFEEKAFNKTGLRVTTKQKLLKGANLEKLNSLSWDQQALVDFLMLEKSTHFTGCSFSSFTMNIAFRRHRMIEGINSRPWRSPGDRFSTLVGRFESWYDDWMFMYECMWP